MRLRSMRAALAAGTIALMTASVPAIAAPGEGGGDSLPTCSATVTDHCMQRGSSHRGMTGRHHARHHGRHHHHHGKAHE